MCFRFHHTLLFYIWNRLVPRKLFLGKYSSRARWTGSKIGLLARVIFCNLCGQISQKHLNLHMYFPMRDSLILPV